jgi:hypothetical protein
VEKTLDRYQIVVRQCRALQPDGYQLVLDIRRPPEPNPTIAPTSTTPDARGAGADEVRNGK